MKKTYISFIAIPLVLASCAPTTPTPKGQPEHSCLDANDDHKCDICGEILTNCVDNNNDYVCDICGAQLETPTYDLTKYYDGYYASLESWENGEDLKNKLHNLISGGTYKALRYVDNFDSNIDADHTNYDYGYLDVIYSKDDVDARKTNTDWQREHCFPASAMTGSGTTNAVRFPGRATDFHNLFAAESAANNSRSNKSYGNADPNNPAYQDRTVDQEQDGYKFDNKNFEPANKDKGKVARAIFYMATMYTEVQEDTKNNVMMQPLKIVEGIVDNGTGSAATYSVGNLSDLLQWNKQPVSDEEAQHNESVYSHVYVKDGYAQGNRNPYVDFPELVDFVYGTKQDEPGILNKLVPSIHLLNRDAEGVHDYAIADAKRDYKYGESFTKSDYSLVAINNDFTTAPISNSTCSLEDGYTFSQVDGTSKVIKITVEDTEIRYIVNIDPSGLCNHTETITKALFDNTKINVDQAIKLDNIDFFVNVDSTSGYTMSNNNKMGGVTLGSTTAGKEIKKITFKSKNTLKIDEAHLEALLGNKDSSYNLTIKVGDVEISNQSITNDKSSYAIYGGRLSTPAEGILAFTISGKSAIGLRNISFNIVE